MEKIPRNFLSVWDLPSSSSGSSEGTILAGDTQQAMMHWFIGLWDRRNTSFSSISLSFHVEENLKM